LRAILGKARGIATHLALELLLSNEVKELVQAAAALQECKRSLFGQYDRRPVIVLDGLCGLGCPRRVATVQGKHRPATAAAQIVEEQDIAVLEDVAVASLFHFGQGDAEYLLPCFSDAVMLAEDARAERLRVQGGHFHEPPPLVRLETVTMRP